MNHLTAGWAKVAAESIKSKLQGYVPRFVALAQEVYDAWEQDEDGESPVYGTGGICDAIVAEWSGMLYIEEPDWEQHDGAREGEDHTWLAVMDFENETVWCVDIDPNVYESGFDQEWTKNPGVRIRPSDVRVFEGDEHPDNFPIGLW